MHLTANSQFYSSVASQINYGANETLDDINSNVHAHLVANAIEASRVIGGYLYSVMSKSIAFAGNFFASMPNFIPGANAVSVSDDNEAVSLKENYIISIKEEASDKLQALIDQVEALGGVVGYKYNQAFTGFSVAISPENLEKLRSNSDIRFIEKVQTAECA